MQEPYYYHYSCNTNVFVATNLHTQQPRNQFRTLVKASLIQLLPPVDFLLNTLRGENVRRKSIIYAFEL